MQPHCRHVHSEHNILVGTPSGSLSEAGSGGWHWRKAPSQPVYASLKGEEAGSREPALWHLAGLWNPNPLASASQLIYLFIHVSD